MLALRLESAGPPPVPRLGRPLPRPDRPVPRRRVQPRQVDGPDRGVPPGRPAGVDRDHRHRRGRAGRRRLEGAVPQEAQRGHRAGRQGRPETGVEKFFGEHADLGAARRPDPGRCRRRPGDRRQLRRLEPGRDDPVRAAVPDAPLAPELLPAQRAARTRPRRCRWSTPSSCAGARAGVRRAVQRAAVTTSSAPRRRRSCSTRSSGSSRPGRCSRSPTPARPASPRPSPCSPAQGGDARGARRRHGPRHPPARRSIRPRWSST